MNTLLSHYPTHDRAFFLPSDETLKSVASTVYKIVDLMSRLPWILAFLIVVPIGFTYTVVSYYPIKNLVKKYQKEISKMLSNLSSLTEEEDRMLMKLHADIARSIPNLDALIHKLQPYYVFHPVYQQLDILLKLFRQSESTFFNHLYPDHNTPITAGEERELIEAFRPWRDEITS